MDVLSEPCGQYSSTSLAELRSADSRGRLSPQFELGQNFLFLQIYVVDGIDGMAEEALAQSAEFLYRVRCEKL
jgi:hypothetical protein